MGLFRGDASAWPLPELPEWSSLSSDEQAFESKRMQVFAAMVANLDTAIGELLAYLDRSGLADDTLVVFASDNGADGTGNGAGFRDGAHDNNVANLGNASSYVTQGLNWAQVSSTPWRLVKAFPTEGGTRAPMIARWPGKVRGEQVSDEWLRISDLGPAILELAGAEPVAATGGTTTGRSALPLLINGTPLYAASDTRIHTYIERRLGGASVLKDTHKLVWWKTSGYYGKPMLFDLSTDPAETFDISATEPDLTQELIDDWRHYADQVGDEISEANP